MSSKLGVQNIAHTNGTNAMTVASDGVVVPSNTAQSAQTFSLQANQAGSGSAGTLYTNLSEVDNDYTRVGTLNWSHSSGVFSSATTGTFLCMWSQVIKGASGGDSYDPSIQISTNSGSNYSARSLAWGFNIGSNSDNLTTTNQFVFTVSNKTTFRLKFLQSTTNDVASSTTIIGHADYVATGLTFIKLGVL